MVGAGIRKRSGELVSRLRGSCPNCQTMIGRPSWRSSPTNMSTKTSALQIGSIEVQVVRKPIKNLHLSILPPDGKVRVSSPLHLKDNAIRTLIAMRLSWIHKHRARFTSQARETPREYVSGESHYLFGRRFRLEVLLENKPPCVYLRGKNKIVLQVRPNCSVARREE